MAVGSRESWLYRIHDYDKSASGQSWHPFNVDRTQPQLDKMNASEKRSLNGIPELV